MLETPSNQTNNPTTKNSSLINQSLLARELAKDYAFKVQMPDFHWVAELESNATITAEYVFLQQMLELDLTAKKNQLLKYFFNQQKPDGSWGIASNYQGDLSTTAEVYLALRILGVAIDQPQMLKAQSYILEQGGLAKVRIFTRINFALFGLFPWNAIPVIPPEFILVPAAMPVNIYRLSSWARGTMVPLFIIFHHQPVFALPNQKSTNNNWLDHLWLNANDKAVAYSKPFLEVVQEAKLSWKTLFAGSDELLKWYEKRPKNIFTKTIREFAVKKCEEWVLAHQEKSGDWAGIFPPMLNGCLALYLQGYQLTDPCLKLGLEAIERFAINDDQGLRVQACESPVWDTVLMMIGLIDSGAALNDERIVKARSWLESKQLLVNHGDWKVYNPKAEGAGWSFEYENSWYPDIDDTAAVVIGLLKQNKKTKKSPVIEKAMQWTVSMQNNDGGWAAFDLNNDKLYLNDIPFSDMDSLCDPSSPDVTGRVLEALGLLKDQRFAQNVERAIHYLRTTQEPEGSWFGRWGVNYIYGTSNVLCALKHHSLKASDAMIHRALHWLKSVQNDDGGWGECLESYANKNLMGQGRSTPSQTAWALMALLAYEPASSISIQRGINWLVEQQIKAGPEAGSWAEPEFTGTGFPNHFYLKYHFYRHYFPMMALGRFLQAKEN